MALDPVFSVQHSVDPEPVQTRLLDHHQRIEFPAACLSFLAEVCKAGKQANGITAGHNMTGNLFASRCKRRHQPGRFAKDAPVNNMILSPARGAASSYNSSPHEMHCARCSAGSSPR